MKPIRIEKGIVIYYGNPAGRIRNGQAVVDPMFKGQELNDFLETQRNVSEIKWQDGIFSQLASGQGETREIQILKNCRVWQLKPEVDICKKFIGYDALIQKFGPPNPEDYRLVFDGAVDTNDLEALYTKFNVDHPASYTGHSLSMSDVVELYDEMESSFHYVDRIGFQKVDFKLPNQEMAHIQTMQF